MRPMCRFHFAYLYVAICLRFVAGQDAQDEAGQCDASSGGSCAPAQVRSIFDKTPTPCKKQYDDEHVKKAAATHVASAPKGNKVPTLLMLLGGSGAGKGTFIKHAKKHGLKIEDYVFHGLDEYLQYLPEYVQSVSDAKAIYKDAADECYGGAIAIAKAAQKDIIASRQHVIYEETGKNLDRILKRVLPPFEEAGYRITAVLVDNSKDIAKIRAIERFQKEGRYAPDDYIEGTFKGVPENYKTFLGTGRVHEATYCDNSCLNKGDGASAATAASASGCLVCWRDEIAAPLSDAFSDHGSLIQESALEKGPIRRLSDGAR